MRRGRTQLRLRDGGYAATLPESRGGLKKFKKYMEGVASILFIAVALTALGLLARRALRFFLSRYLSALPWRRAQPLSAPKNGASGCGRPAHPILGPPKNGGRQIPNAEEMNVKRSSTATAERTRKQRKT
jgi:hypothetical protein